MPGTQTSLRYYWGFGKEAIKGTPVAPVSFPRWLDGTTIDPKIANERVLEGDGGRDAAFTLKKNQEYHPVINTYARPIEAGALIAAAFGTGCDAVSGSTPTNSTTLSAGTAIGATSISSVTTFVGSTIIQIDVAGISEVRTVTTVTGAGPFTVNFVLPLVRAHLSGVAVANVVAPFTHAQVPTNTPDFFAVEAALLTGDIGNRVADCLVEEITIEGGAGMPVKFGVKWLGLVGTRQVSPATVTVEAGQPYLFSGGTFTLDGGGSAFIEKFKLTYKNITESPQTTKVTDGDLIWGRRTLDVDYTLLFQDDTLYRKFFYGSGSGTTDSQYVGNGSFEALLLPGDLASMANTLDLLVPSVDYYGDEPTFDLQGKAVRYNVKGYGIHGAAALVTATSKHSVLAAYS